jgi:hypothetical protein
MYGGELNSAISQSRRRDRERKTQAFS